jgi:hypothetical protein
MLIQNILLLIGIMGFSAIVPTAIAEFTNGKRYLTGRGMIYFGVSVGLIAQRFIF